MIRIKAVYSNLKSWAAQNTLQAYGIFLCIILFFVASFVISEVMEGESKSIDTAILLFVRDAQNNSGLLGQGKFQELMRDITGLGSTVILTLLTMAVTTYLFLMKKYGASFYVLCAVGTGILFSSFLKEHLNRPRPDVIPHATLVHSASLPSGHALMSALVYLTLGALIAKTQSRNILKIYIMAVAVILALLVGFSRIYLGVHWPSDVITGWLVGAAWALMFWLIADWTGHRRLVL